MRLSLSPLGFLGKYRQLALYIGSLIIVFIAVLLGNLYFSTTIERNTQKVNLAAQQSASVQQISKELFIITSQYQKVLPYAQEKRQLKSTMDAFERSLTAFLEGGEVITSNGEILRLNKETDTAYIKTLNQAKKVWKGYNTFVYIIFESLENSQRQLVNASAYAEENNALLSTLVEQYATGLRNRSDNSLTLMRMAQLLGISVALLMFFFTIFSTVRRLLNNDKEIDKARRETQEILNTVREGLFLIDKNLTISGQYSVEMEEIFKTDNIANKTLDQLLEQVLTDSDIKTLQGFLALLFDDNIIEDLIGTLNPLEKVQLNFLETNGNFEKKHLNFEFYRVMQGEQIQDILVSVRDITQQIELEQKLESTREEGEKQAEMLVSLLQADTTTLHSFLKTAKQSLADINNVLKEPINNSHDYQTKIERMFVKIHRLKGDSSAIRLGAFSSQLHAFESELERLKQTYHMEGMDFLPLTIRLDKLISYVDAMYSLATRLNHNHQTTPDNVEIDRQQSQWKHLENLATDVAADQGKQVQLISSGLYETQLDEETKQGINEILIQLLRNAVVHGIETVEERRKNNKPDIGRIDIRLAKRSDEQLELTIRDDGRGINFEAVKAMAIKEGVASTHTIMKWSNTQLVNVLFSSGFSMASDTTIHAGRGIGMEAVGASLRNIGGLMRLNQSAGKFCEFYIELPTHASHA